MLLSCDVERNLMLLSELRFPSVFSIRYYILPLFPTIYFFHDASCIMVEIEWTPVADIGFVAWGGQRIF